MEGIDYVTESSLQQTALPYVTGLLISADRNNLNDIRHINPARIRFPGACVPANDRHQRIDLLVFA